MSDQARIDELRVAALESKAERARDMARYRASTKPDQRARDFGWCVGAWIQKSRQYGFTDSETLQAIREFAVEYGVPPCDGGEVSS